MHGDDFTFAGTEPELKKIRAKMCEWYDVQVRGVLGSGKRDVREIEILGRTLTWTEEGLVYECSDKHRQAFLEGLGLNEESKAVNSAAMKPEEINQEEDTERLDVPETKRVQEFGSDVELLEFGQIGRAVRSEGSVHKDGKSDSRQLEEDEESRRISERS